MDSLHLHYHSPQRCSIPHNITGRAFTWRSNLELSGLRGGNTQSYLGVAPDAVLSQQQGSSTAQIAQETTSAKAVKMVKKLRHPLT
eukprot:19446-Pelagomonas_calceolata.AAC.3